jgi:type I restriction enzyme S subunit
MNRREVKKAPVLRFKGFTNDWEQRKLGTAIKIIKDKNKNQHSYRAFSISNIKGFIAQDEQFGKDNTYSKTDKSTNYIVKPGMFAYNPARINVGSIAYQNQTEPVLVSSLYEIFQTNSKIDDSFLMNWFKTSLFNRQIKRLEEGGVRQYFFIDKMKETEIKLPSISEQNQISKLLQLVSKNLDLQQRKLKLLKEIRKGIVENIRDNNFEYKEQKNDFKDVKIKDMFKITRGKVLPKEKISSNKISPNIYPVFSSQTLNNGLLGFYKDYLFQNAITWTTDGANAGTVNFRNEKFYSTNVNGVLLQKKIKPDLLTADLLNLVAFKYVSKVGNPKLMNNTMANIRIKIPSNTNARIFYSKILNKCDTKIDFINKKIDYLTTFKRFLLQNMFI